MNVSKEPESVVAKNGDKELTVEKVDSFDAFKKAEPAEGKAVYFYEQTPNLNYGATARASRYATRTSPSSRLTPRPSCTSSLPRPM